MKVNTAVVTGVLMFALVLIPVAAGHTIEGYVRTMNDAPVFDARVSLRDANRNRVDWYSTDKTGYYRFYRVPDGTYDIDVEKEGFQAQTINIEAVGFTARIFRRDITIYPLGSTMNKRGDENLNYHLPADVKIDRKALKLVRKAEKLEAKQEWEAALELYRKAAAIAPGFSRAHNGIGTTLQQLQHTDEALSAFQQAVAANPEDPVPLINLGGLLTALERFTEAIVPLDKAVALDGTLAKGHFYLGSALYSLEIFDRSGTELLAATALDALAFPTAWAMLGNIYLKDGDYRQALRAYRRFLDLAPNSPQANQVRETIRQLEKSLATPLLR